MNRDMTGREKRGGNQISWGSALILNFDFG